MRLFDWMIRPGQVYVTGTEEGGLYASDQLVIISLSEADASKNDPAKPGIYEIRATRPAISTGQVKSPAAEVLLADKLAAVEASAKKWHQISWSPVWQHGQARVGSLNGVPCGVDHEWLTRLPAGYVLRGHHPHKPFLIQRVRKAGPIGKVPATRTNVGIISPVKFSNPSPVLDAITRELLE